MRALWRRFLTWLADGPDCWRDQDFDDPNDEYRRKRSNAARGIRR